MIANLTANLDFHSKALVLRADRQRIIASNIANVDTPGYVARDINFKDALSQATESSAGNPAGTARMQLKTSGTDMHTRHIPLTGLPSGSLDGASSLAYAVQSQPSVDGNSVDLDRERANFADNSVRYEATLRFINGQSKTILSAIQGQ
jgi:flagellar basal-body rod protein FlgB